MKVGNHVRVTTRHIPKFDGQHPQAGKTGNVIELMGVVTGLFTPKAQVKIDDGFEDAGNVMIVSLEYLEEITQESST